MLPQSPPPRIRTAFRDRRPEAEPRDLIAPSEFFTPEDFLAADHRVHGLFDQFGDFAGAVHIYGGDARAYDYVWTGAQRKALACGAFAFDLAYVQGDARDTRLPPTEHARVTQKLDRIGGLYIYRDDIRVLPYGTPGYDFLGIERRRTENLSRAFFSYRRMFGVIQLTSVGNFALQEKAGREGFIQNAAYRQFRDLLSSFFVDLAAEFFTKQGNRSSEFEEGRAAARERQRLRRDREARASRARQRFAGTLATLATDLRDGVPQQIAATALNGLEHTLVSIGTDSSATDLLRGADATARAQIEDGRNRFHISAPTAFGLTQELRTDFDDLHEQLLGLDTAVWEPALQQVAYLVDQAARALGAASDPALRLEAAVGRAAEASKARLERAVEDLRDNDAALDLRVSADVSRHRTAFATAVQDILDDAATAPAWSMAAEQLGEYQVALEQRLRAVTSDLERELHHLAERIALVAASNGDGSEAETAALEEELLGLRERADQDLELAQIGMATEVLTHELDLTIVGLRGALNRLDGYVATTPKLTAVYNDLRTGFDHLDTYLALFTPLQRRLARRRLLIKGSQIASFLRELFARRLEDGNIELRVTQAFEAWRGQGFRSTIYPVFVNLVDNATYWVTQARPPRWVRLDVDAGDLLVSDSGPGIPSRDVDAVWQFGFTRKPGGRGAGLHIARETLHRDGWELCLDPNTDGSLFRIHPPQDG
jgi:signal transduction histidine kinase